MLEVHVRDVVEIKVKLPIATDGIKIANKAANQIVDGGLGDV